jgi:hypothetical protein
MFKICSECELSLERKIYTFNTGSVKMVYSNVCNNRELLKNIDIDRTCLEILGLMLLDEDIYRFKTAREYIEKGEYVVPSQ